MKTNAQVIAEDILGQMDLKLTPATAAQVIQDLDARLAYDAAARKYVLMDDSGNPALTADGDGNVRAVNFHEYFVDLARNSPALFQAGTSASTLRNPFSPEYFNLTRQAELLQGDPEAAAKLKAEAATKTGADNPFKKGPGWNLTQQAQLLKVDPTRAERLKREAGGQQ